MAAIEIDDPSRRFGAVVAVDAIDGLQDATASGESRYVYAPDLTGVESALEDLLVQHTSHDREVPT